MPMTGNRVCDATTPDPECDLFYAPNESVDRDVKVALSNSFGFGGHNVAIVTQRWNTE